MKAKLNQCISGVYRRSENIRIFIDIKAIAALHTISLDDSLLIVGANVSIAELMETLQKAAAKYETYAYAMHLVKHLDLGKTENFFLVKARFNCSYHVF